MSETGRDCICKDIAAALGLNLRAWRKRKRMPLKCLAMEMGVSTSVVSAWERGGRFPSASHLAALSKYMGVPLCVLLCPCGVDVRASGCPRRRC